MHHLRNAYSKEYFYLLFCSYHSFMLTYGTFKPNIALKKSNMLQFSWKLTRRMCTFFMKIATVNKSNAKSNCNFHWNWTTFKFWDQPKPSRWLRAYSVLWKYFWVNFSCNCRSNILKHHNIFLQVWFTPSKTDPDIYITLSFD